MRWKPKPRGDSWRRAFAVTPTEIEGVVVWMEWIEIQTHADGSWSARLPKTETT